MDSSHPTVERGATACPACGGKLLSILYGLPSGEGFRMAERGEVVLGGCIVGGDDPQFACAKCRERYWPSKGTTGRQL